VTNLILNIALVIVIPPGWSWLCGRLVRRYRANFYQGRIGAAIGDALASAFYQQWLWVLLAAANAGVAIVLWWLSRRRRKRAPRSYGAKSRALVAALVRKARKNARPRPVPRLGPAGAQL